jgi:hypothetical protein
VDSNLDLASMGLPQDVFDARLIPLTITMVCQSVLRHFPVLPCHLVGIVEDQDSGLEVDVLLLVARFLGSSQVKT